MTCSSYSKETALNVGLDVSLIKYTAGKKYGTKAGEDNCTKAGITSDETKRWFSSRVALVYTTRLAYKYGNP
jgi:hypothetical protein